MKRRYLHRGVLSLFVALTVLIQPFALNIFAAVGTDVRDYLAESTDPTIGDSILTGSTITFGPVGSPTTTPTIEDDVNFNFTFALPEEIRAKIQDGDFYSFTLPNEIAINNPIAFPLKDGEGNTYANVTIGTDGVVTMTFTSVIATLNDINGSFGFTGSLDPEGITGPGDITIVIPEETQLPSTTVEVKPNTESMVEKDGHFDRTPNPNYAIWNIDINKAMDTLTNVVVTDTIPTGLTLESTVVSKMDVDLNGDIVEDTEVALEPGVDYTVDANGTVEFLISPLTDAYRITHKTKIDDAVKPIDGKELKFMNSAMLNSTEHVGLTASDTIVTQFKKPVAKANTGYDPVTQIASWQIEYNYNEQTIEQALASFTDSFDNPDMKYQEGSLEIYPITYNSSGNVVVGTTPLAPGTDYTLTPDATGGFTVQFANDVTQALKVTYKSHYEGIIDEKTTVVNSVATGEEHESGGSVGMNQQGLVKGVIGVDYEDRKVEYKIHVNGSHYEMDNWRMVDTLGPGLVFDTTSVMIQNLVTQTPLVLNTDYTVGFDTTEKELTIIFINAYANDVTADFSIAYIVDFSPSNLPEGETQFHNGAQSTWDDEFGNGHTNNSTAIFKPDGNQLNSGSKSGSYNAVTKLITWEIVTNYNVEFIRDGKLEDKILGNQVYVPGSLRIFTYEVDFVTGEIINKTPVDPAVYASFPVEEPSAANDQTLTIDIGTETSQYIFEFDTSLEGQIVHGGATNPYKNTAIFSAEGKYHEYEAELTIANGDTTVTKSGNQNTAGFMDWNVTVNPAQSTLTNVKVVDVPSSNQFIKLDTLVINGTTLDAAGVITLDPTVVLQEGVDYSVDYSQNDDGNFQLTVVFLHQINKAYIMQYEAIATVEPGEVNPKATNNVTISGDNNETITGNGGGSINIDINQGGGVAMGGTLRTDATGHATITGLLYGTYTLKEVVATPGYSVSPELHAGVSVVVDASTSAGAVYTVVNEASTVRLLKTNEMTDRLADVTFELFKKDGTTWTQIREDEDFITNGQGQIEIRALELGTYKLVEVEASIGYIINTTPIEFDVVDDGNGFIPVVMLDTFINYQATAQLTKTDENATVLAGALFKLVDKDGNQVGDILTTDTTGILKVEGLAPGTYSWIEISAPANHTVNAEPITFTVEKEYEGKPDVIKKTSVNTTIPTPVGPNEPKGVDTGDQTNIARNTAFLLLSGFAVIVYTRIKKKKVE